MSPELEQFLSAVDLDEVLRAFEPIQSLDTEDITVVRLVLQHWENPQSVSNLLLHPTLIPEDIRLASLFRALAERDMTYYVLAAVVGFQNIDPASMTADERKRCVDELLALVGKTTGILAERASVSVQQFLTIEDAKRVFAFWSHPDDAVWHNLRAWLFSTFQGRGVESFALAARGSGLPEVAQRGLVEDFAELAGNPPEQYDSRLGLLFGYIPNLRDCQETRRR